MYLLPYSIKKYHRREKNCEWIKSSSTSPHLNTPIPTHILETLPISSFQH